MSGKRVPKLQGAAAVFLVPVAVLLSPAALAGEGDESAVVSCSNDVTAATIRIAESGINASACELYYNNADGHGETTACGDNAEEFVSKLASKEISCPLTVAGPANGPVGAIPISASDQESSPATAITVAQADPSGEGEDEFSLEISEETAGEAKPVYTSYVEAGVGWVSDDSAEFGKFSGLNTDGAFVIGNIGIRYRNPKEDRSNEYFFIDGVDLGLESRSLYGEYGQQGLFSVFAAFDSIPRFLHDDARTPFILQDDGTTFLLPADWVPGDRNIADMTLLNQSLHDIDVSHKREKSGGGFSWLPSENWSVKSSFYHETKQGTRTIGAIFGSSGGDPAGMIVPEPVDYKTDTFDASVNYAGERAQAALSYNLSLFHDNNDSIVFQNPYFSSRWAPAASYPDGFGRTALPPDNWAHRFSFAGSYLLTLRTRATAQVSYGRMRQNDDFLPFTVNPGLIANTLLPRQSLDGEITTWNAALGVSSKISPRFTLRANYRFEDRDNNTPRNVYIYVPGDVQNQNTIFSADARINRPYSRKQHLAEIEAAYRLTKKSRFTAGYEYEQLERDFTEVETTREHKVNGKFQINPTLRTVAWVGAEYSVRRGSDYIGNLPFLTSHTPEFLGPDPQDEFENHPFLKKYYIADRDRLKVHGTMNWAARDNMNLGVVGRYNDDQYDDTTLGLTGSTQYSVTGDWSFQPRKGVDLHVFYTYDNIKYMQAGLSWNSRLPAPDIFNIALRGWNVDTRDKIHTVGAGASWTAIKDTLDFKLDYYFSDATTRYDISAGTAIGFTPLPDLDTTLHSLEVLAKYQFSEQLALKFRYLFANNDVTDFALDGVDPDTMSFIIGLGNQAPDYSVHVIGVSTVFEF